MQLISDEAIKVTYKDHMGTDDSVVDAARVSFHKEASQFPPHRNVSLIKFLANAGHELPFAHTAVQVHCSAPIFLARQLGKHQVGLVWNEISRRYVDYTPDVYFPEKWRRKAEDKKQGSLEESVNDSTRAWASDAYLESVTKAVTVYEDMLHAGVAPELARIVLPQSAMTEWIWTGNVLSFARVYNLRIGSDAQKEAQVFAKSLASVVEPLFPNSWKALTSRE